MTESFHSIEQQNKTGGPSIPEISPDAVSAVIQETARNHGHILSPKKAEFLSHEGESITGGVLRSFNGNVGRVIVTGLLGLSLLAVSPGWVHGAEGGSRVAERQNTPPNFGDLSRTTEQAAKDIIAGIKKLDDALRELSESLEKRMQEHIERKLGKDFAQDG